MLPKASNYCGEDGDGPGEGTGGFGPRSPSKFSSPITPADSGGEPVLVCTKY